MTEFGCSCGADFETLHADNCVLTIMTSVEKDFAEIVEAHMGFANNLSVVQSIVSEMTARMPQYKWTAEADGSSINIQAWLEDKRIGWTEDWKPVIVDDQS